MKITENAQDLPTSYANPNNVKPNYTYKKEILEMNGSKFYICEHCGNIVGLINDAGVPLVCCGQKMTRLEPGTVEASIEKHLPVVTVDKNSVKAVIGAVNHPMTSEHSITWVYLETNKGGQRKNLAPDSAPEVCFALTDDEKPVAVYAYCNLHGLWKTEI